MLIQLNDIQVKCYPFGKRHQKEIIIQGSPIMMQYMGEFFFKKK